MLSYPSSMSVSSRSLTMLADALRQERRARRTRWRRLDPGEQALLVLAYLRKGETYPDLAGGFGIGLTTVFRYIREALDVLAAVAVSLDTALEVARREAFVIVDGTLLRTDRVGITGGGDPRSTPGNTRDTGSGVQGLADPAERLIWSSPALPGAQHDMGAGREHSVFGALEASGARVIAEAAYRGAGANVEVPHHRPPRDPETGERHRRLSANEKAVNSAHTRLRGPGKRANAQLKSWKILRKVRSNPRLATRPAPSTLSAASSTQAQAKWKRLSVGVAAVHASGTCGSSNRHSA